MATAAQSVHPRIRIFKVVGWQQALGVIKTSQFLELLGSSVRDIPSNPHNEGLIETGCEQVILPAHRRWTVEYIENRFMEVLS